MPARIDDATRAAILDAIRAGGRSRASIAREHGVAPSTVRNIAAENGIAKPFDTAGTRAATAAARDHLRHRRATVSALFLDAAQHALEATRKPVTVYAFTKFGECFTEQLSEPPPVELRNLMTAAGIAFDKHLAADRHDAVDDDQGAGEVLDKLFDGLAGAYQALRGRGPRDDEQPTHDDPVGG